MAEYYIDPENGSDAAAGTELAPWRLIPGQAGANAVGANDILNIKNGTTSNGGTITPPANGLRYRGYGLASNVLWISVPSADPKYRQMMRVVREEGVHEGMWKVDMAGAAGVGISIANSRSGVVIEDIHIFNNGGGNPLIRVGTSSSTSADGGFTLRRFFIEGADGNGVAINKFNPTIEYGKVLNTVGDNISCVATTSNSDRAGSVDTFRFLDLQYPNYNYAGVPYGDGGGDNLQTIPNGTTGIYAGKVVIHDILMVKGSFDPTWPSGFGGKQALLVHDGLNGIFVSNIHLFGATPDAQIGVLLGTLRGAVTLQNLYFGGNNAGLQTIRLSPGANPIGTDLMATGSSLTIRNVVNTALTKSAFFSCAENVGFTLAMDGTLTIENCTLQNEYVADGYSYDADVSLQGGDISFGANFKLNLRNNIFDTAKPKLKMPTGTANDADYSVKNNWFRPSTSFYIGSTEYTSLTAFAAAHNAATGNLDGDLELDAVTLLPETVASPQVGAGTHVEYRRDAQGVQRYNPPCQGAYEFLRDRGVR